MKKFNYFLLFLIVCLGGFLRLYGLATSPPSLNWDEAALGYNAYSISQTLKDEYGQTLPIFTRSFDDYKSALPVYLMIPSIKIFGLNEVGVRLPSALLGTLTILLIFFLVKEIFQSDTIALASSLMFAIEPWAVHFARTIEEANIALFLLFLGWLLFLYSKKQALWLPISAIFFMLSMYIYHANKLVVPLFLLSLAILNRKSLKTYSRKLIFITIAILTFSLGVFAILAFQGEALARITSTNILVLWGDEPKNLAIEHPLPAALNFLVHNNLFYFIWNIVGRYFAYFSPPNLFLREPFEPVAIVAGNSIFHPFEFIFWAIGLIFLIRNFKRYQEILILMLVAPIPAMLTWNWFQPLRGMSLFAVFSILTGLGVVKSIHYLALKLQDFIKPATVKISSWLIFSLITMASAIYLFDSIMVELPFRDSGNWQPGFREAVPIVYKLSQNYDQVIIDTAQAQPYIFYLFYSQYPPKQYLSEINLEKMGTPRKYWDFGKFKFRKIYWPVDKALHKTLFVGDIYGLPQHDIGKQLNAQVRNEIKDQDGNIMTKIVAVD